MDLQTIVRVGKCSEHGASRRTPTPSVRKVRWVPVIAGSTPFDQQQIRIQTRQWGNITAGNNDGWNGLQTGENSKSSP